MPNQQTAVAVVDDFQPRQVISIGNYDRAKFNVLIPGAFTTQVTPFLVPVAREYTLDPDPEHGEVYVQEWTKRDGQYVAKAVGINALGLSNLANVAGILEIPQASGRVDDGRDPGVCTYRSTMFMRLPDGQPVIRSREMTLELSTLLEEVRDRIEKKGRENRYQGKADPWPKDKVEAEIRKESILTKKFFHRKCETGAKARTHRVMLGIRSKYTPAEIARPFVLAAVVPDVNQPEVRSRMLDQATSAIGMLYGPGGADVGTAPRQLAAGAAQPTPAEVEAAAQEPDAVSAAATAEEIAFLAGVAAPDAGDDAGEEEPTSGGEPAWMTDAMGTPAAAAPAETDIAQLLRDTAAASGMKGAATEPQRAKLKELLGGLEPPGAVTTALVYLWGEGIKTSLTAAQGQTLLNAAESMGTDEFLAAIRSIAERAKAAA